MCSEQELDTQCEESMGRDGMEGRSDESISEEEVEAELLFTWQEMDTGRKLPGRVYEMFQESGSEAEQECGGEVQDGDEKQDVGDEGERYKDVIAGKKESVQRENNAGNASHESVSGEATPRCPQPAQSRTDTRQRLAAECGLDSLLAMLPPPPGPARVKWAREVAAFKERRRARAFAGRRSPFRGPGHVARGAATSKSPAH